ncbi:unnamed protein product [Callosobruchus maculatus]|uniref:Uncharacterized protein n=1 Tax=Callosobruchus maculatus TaxID=64391 RepID=A0A653BSZ3_CALMS|nr:unnamed protein product [Callosobruchus maculatus]
MEESKIVPGDYESLKAEYLSLRKELEVVNQEVYNQKREVGRLLALEGEYQSEIEVLQKEDVLKKCKYEDQIAHLEETINAQRSKYNSKLLDLENAVSQKEEENSQLRMKIEEMSKTDVTSTDGETTKLMDEIDQLKEEIDGYKDVIEEYSNSFEELKEQNVSLQQNYIACNEELVSVRECLTTKKEELTEAHDLIQRLNDEILCLKNELETYKSQPLDRKSKGNSLFAEVDDRRVHLQQVNKEMKESYLAMKAERMQHLDTIRRLKLENCRLTERWRSDYKEIGQDDAAIKETYQERITVLENLVEQYQNDLAAKPLVIVPNDLSHYKYFDLMLKEKSEKIEELRQRLFEISRNEIFSAETIKRINEERRKWRIEAYAKEKLLEYYASQTDDEAVKKTEQKAKAELRNSDVVDCRETFSKYRSSSRRTSAWCSLRELSSDDEEVQSPEIAVKQEADTTKIKTEPVKDDDEPIKIESDDSVTEVKEVEAKKGYVEDKENVPDNLPNRERKNVRFTEGTVSPLKSRPTRRGTVVAHTVVRFDD